MFKNFKEGLQNIYERYDNPIFEFAKKAYVAKRRNFINFRQYDRHHKFISKELNNELNKVMNFRNDFEFWFYTRDFEKKFAKLCGTKFALGTHSGTSALQLSLLSLGIGQGDEVITTPNTYIATCLAISNVGARPVFVDVDEQTFNIDVDKIEKAITGNTKAILPVHLYGQMANMSAIMKIAKKYKLFVIEDACQSFGAEYKGQKPGTLGDLGCFSFFTGKNLSGLGNGGIIISNKIKLKEKLEKLRDPESNCEELILSKRTPCYLDAIQIAFLKAKLPFIKNWIDLRRQKARLYNENLKDNTNITIPKEKENSKHSYYSYVIKCKDRDKLKKFLFKNHIETQIEYQIPLHLTKTYQYLKYKKGNFAVTEKLVNEILSLPISPFLKKEEVIKIINNIKYFIQKNDN